MLLVTFLRFELNLPYGKIALLLNRLFNAGISEGSVVAYVKRMAQLLGSEYESIKSAIREENLCVDETGKRIAGENLLLGYSLAARQCSITPLRAGGAGLP